VEGADAAATDLTTVAVVADKLATAQSSTRAWRQQCLRHRVFRI
jgi:hypothetical protein